MSGSAAPGWYADPSDAAGLRWWDGQTWTAATHPAQPAQSEPAYAAQQPVQSHPAFAQQAQPAAHPAFAQQAQSLPAYAAAGYGQSSYPPAAYAQPFNQVLASNGAQSAGWERNRYAFFTFGIVALYFFIAMTSRIVFFGILPLGMSLRSKRGGEPLAPFAIGVAVLSIVVAFIALSHH